jgi:transposase-like protein
MEKKSYTKEFKLEAVKLALEGEGKIGQTAKNLGVSHSALAKWIRAFKKNGTDSFPGKGKLMPDDERVRKLESQLRRVTMERDILKKTIGYLAEVPK